MLRTGLSWLLWTVTAALVIGTIIGLAAGNGGTAYLLLVAMCTGSGARAVAIAGRPRPGTAAGTRAAGSGAGQGEPAASGPIPPTGRPGLAEPAWTERDLRRSHHQQQRADPGQPPPDPQVRYTERASNLPVTGAAIAVALLAGGLAGLVSIGGPNGGGAGPAGAVLLLAAAVSAIYVLFVLIDLPNGILIGDGRFAVGVAGVPAAGRMWRRIQGPLDAVHSWEVLSPEQIRQLRRERAAARRAGQRRQYLGDLRLFGRRGVLRLRVDQGAVQASLPARILLGYVFVDAAAAGAVWDGTLLIGTRHGGELAAALDRALPGRRAAAPG